MSSNSIWGKQRLSYPVRRKKSYEEMCRRARRHQGECLSRRYVNSQTRMKFRCADGHVWYAFPQAIRRGAWCRKCTGLAKLDLQAMHAHAAQRAGLCLSRRYINLDTPLLWECQHGHRWKASPNSIRHNQSWCPRCSSRKLTIEQMQTLARERGGKCLSDVYVDRATHLVWECSSGHQWPARPQAVMKGTWCPVCAVEARRTGNYLRRRHSPAS